MFSRRQRAIFTKIDDLTRAVSRLILLHAHDGQIVLRNCFSMSKLMYILCISPCSGNHLLKKNDAVPIEGLTKILNIDLIQWSQANLPLSARDLVIRSAMKKHFPPLRLPPHQHCHSRTPSTRRESSTILTMTYATRQRHEPVFQMHRHRRLNSSTYRKCGIDQQLTVN